MSDFWIFAGPLIGGFLLYGIIRAIILAPGEVLKQKFRDLGDLRGKSLEEIVAVVGTAQSLSGAADGRTIVQWMSAGYHIALIFDADAKCEGVSHETL